MIRKKCGSLSAYAQGNGVHLGHYLCKVNSPMVCRASFAAGNFGIILVETVPFLEQASMESFIGRYRNRTKIGPKFLLTQ